MKTHFTSCGYLTIKTPEGQYHFRGTTTEAHTDHLKEMRERRDRLERYIAALDSYLKGETVSNPDALR